jgi:hypothetical protein
MGITPNFTRADVQKRLDAFLDQIVEQQIERAQMLGEMCMNHARFIPKAQGYEDQSGNLRSSTGYEVFVDGVAVHSSYIQVGGGAEGVRAGKALALKIGQDTEGVCLVVTAGMNYAVHLETKGRDVLTSTEHLAERELPRMLEKLVANIHRATE